MALYPKFRDVHLYAGLIVLAPVVAISATGFLLNHEHSLGLHPKKFEQKHDAAEHSATKLAAIDLEQDFRATHDAWTRHASAVDRAVAEARKAWGGEDVPLDRIELKNEHGQFVVKVKALKGSRASPEEIVWGVAEQDVLVETHEGNWIKDLHTGKIFSHEYGYFWSDVAAVALVLLSLTGLVLYVIPLVKKRAKKSKTAAARSAAPSSSKATALAQARAAAARKAAVASADAYVRKPADEREPETVAATASDT